MFSVLLAVASAAPVASPDDDKQFTKLHHFVGAPSVVYQGQVSSPAVGFTQVVNPQTAVFKTTGQQVVSGTAGAVGTVGFVPGAVAYSGSIDFDDDDDVKVVGGQVIHHAIGHQQVGGVAYQHAAVPAVATVHHGAPTVSTYNTAQYVAHAPAVSYSPAVATTHSVAAAPAVSAYAAAVPGVATHAVAAPAILHAAPVQYQAQVEVSEPVVTVHQQAVPSSVTYQFDQAVQVGTKEIDVPVETTHVHVPVEKRVHYGLEKYVAGSSSTIHKPKLSAPAIKPPAVFAQKTVQAPPEITVQHSEVVVEEKSPNYVHAKYDAGVETEKAPDAVETYDVPTPVEVPQPVPVAQPYAVPVAQPVKIKSEVSPVYEHNVHQFETQNIVNPIEYTAHHVATPVVQAVAPAVAVQGQVVAAAPAAEIATGHVFTGQTAVNYAQHGHVYSGQAVAVPSVGATTGQFVTGQVAGVFPAQGHAVTGYAAPAVFSQGHFEAGSPVAVAYGVQGTVAGGQQSFVTGESGETKTVAYGANFPAHGQWFVQQQQPIQFESSGDQIVSTNFVQVPSLTYSENFNQVTNPHAAPVATVPDNN